MTRQPPPRPRPFMVLHREENTHHQKRSLAQPEPFPWRSLREHMVTWLWDIRGLDVLRLLFPVKRFKILGYDKSLWCSMLSMECGNKGDRGERWDEVWCGGDSSSDLCLLLVTRKQSSLWSYSRGGKRCPKTPTCFNGATATKQDHSLSLVLRPKPTEAKISAAVC